MARARARKYRSRKRSSKTKYAKKSRRRSSKGYKSKRRKSSYSSKRRYRKRRYSRRRRSTRRRYLSTTKITCTVKAHYTANRKWYSELFRTTYAPLVLDIHTADNYQLFRSLASFVVRRSKSTAYKAIISIVKQASGFRWYQINPTEQAICKRIYANCIKLNNEYQVWVTEHGPELKKQSARSETKKGVQEKLSQVNWTEFFGAMEEFVAQYQTELGQKRARTGEFNSTATPGTRFTQDSMQTASTYGTEFTFTGDTNFSLSQYR